MDRLYPQRDEQASMDEVRCAETLFLNVVRDGRIDWYEFYRRSPAERRLIVRGFVLTGIMLRKHNPHGFSYQVSFRNHISRKKFSCRTVGSHAGPRHVILTSLEDALAFSKSWKAWRRFSTVIEEYEKGVYRREIDPESTGFLGKDWS